MENFIADSRFEMDTSRSVDNNSCQDVNRDNAGEWKRGRWKRSRREVLEVAQTLNHATGADGQQLQGIGAPTQPYAVAVRQDDAIAFGQQTLGKQLLHRGAGSGGGILP